MHIKRESGLLKEALRDQLKHDLAAKTSEIVTTSRQQQSIMLRVGLGFYESEA